MKIREFRGRDERHVLDLLDESTPQDRMRPEVFRYKVVLQEGFEPSMCLIAEQGSDIIGFIFAPVRNNVGYINIIGIKTKFQRKGVGTELLREIEWRHKERGVNRIVVSGGPRYIVPGVDIKAYPAAVNFFLKNGFKEVSRDSVSMCMSLMDYDTPKHVLEIEKKLIDEGYRFKQLDEDHVLDLLLFLRSNFPSWEEDLRRTLERQPDHLELVTIALRGKEIVGYCQVATDGLIEHFGPFGVLPEQRNRGIGTVIFHRCLRMIQSKGARNVWFAWGGGRNYSFYKKQGMTEMRRFIIMSKEI
ncbi:MAG: GNAT family N-acetyltransferase [Thermoproteota archaeon]